MEHIMQMNYVYISIVLWCCSWTTGSTSGL